MVGVHLCLPIFLIIIPLGSGCEDAPVLPDLIRRARNVVYSEGVPVVEDFLLQEGWYSATTQHYTYVIVDKANMPDVHRCGTVYAVYLNGERPDITSLPDDENGLNYEACLRSYDDECAFEYDIRIRNCGGQLQYYLKAVRQLSAYCFDPLDMANLQGAFPQNVVLGTISITPRLSYREETRLVGGDNMEFVYSSIEFECRFSTQPDFYYYIEWFANNERFLSLGPTIDVAELLLTEDMFLDNGITLGVNLICGVSVSTEVNGLRTLMAFSTSYFVGIIFNEETLHISKTTDGVISFKTTIPIGCTYNNKVVPYCKLSLRMFERNYECESESKTLHTLVNSEQKRCGIDIPTLKKDETWNPDKEYSFTITTVDENYEDRSTFIQEFIVTSGVEGNAHWHGYRPNSITVIVDDIGVNRNKYCYSHIDPHLKTPDGTRYDNHEDGTYLLYRNKKYEILVQERLKRCNYNLAMCTCAVVVKAGADIVLFDTCVNGVSIIEYKECGDGGILRTKRILDNKYQVYTPIGTSITIRLFTYGLYNGMMNVNIHMSPKDLHNIEGLCGDFDGNAANDLTTSSGQLFKDNSNHQFSKTWKVNDEDNYFLFEYPPLEPWSEENPLFCYCLADSQTEDIVNEATCASSPFIENNCYTTRTNDVTDKFCTVVDHRFKRSTSNHVKEQRRRFMLARSKELHNRQERSEESTPEVTETEANQTCTEILRQSLVANDFTQFMAPGEIEAKIEQCIFDSLDSNSLLPASVQHDAMNSLVDIEIEQDPVYMREHLDQVKHFKDQSCQNNCSARGTCLDGSCQCDTYFHGAACAIDERDQLAITDITGGGFCDLQTSDCTCFSLLTRQLTQTFTYKYTVSYFTSSDDYVHVEATTASSGEYMSIFEGLVCVATLTSNDKFVTHYNISISNDNNTFSEPIAMHAYDSTCLQYSLQGNGMATFTIMRGYCRINGTCYNEHSRSVDNNCNVCQTSSNSTAWTSVCSKEDSGDDNIPVGVIIASVIGGGVFICLITAVIVRKTMTRTRTQDSEDTSMSVRPHSSLSARSESDVVAMFTMEASSTRSNSGTRLDPSVVTAGMSDFYKLFTAFDHDINQPTK